MKLLTWWRPESPVSGYDMVLADGAIRSGKTVAMICSFLQWSMSTYENQAFIIAGKSIGALKRNVVRPMLQIVETWGWNYIFNRSNGVIKIGSNEYYLFGANNEASQDILQGLTAAGGLGDEAALFPQSFVNQMIGRCSVEGARLFFNCNPAGGKNHPFYKEYIEQVETKNIYYMHFLMDDNYSLPISTKQRYERMFKGTFYNRNVKGQWIVAEGLIYQAFADAQQDFIIKKEDIPRSFMKILIGVDWGDNKSAYSFVAVGVAHGYGELIPLLSEKHNAKGAEPRHVEQWVCDFVEKVIKRYGRADMINCDHINAFINGCRTALKKRGLNVPIGQAYKAPIIERIITTIKLIGLSHLRLTEDCATLAEALATAVWDPDKENTRLDDGSSDIDTLDAFEYAWSSYLDMFNII